MLGVGRSGGGPGVCWGGVCVCRGWGVRVRDREKSWGGSVGVRECRVDILRDC